MSNRKTHEQFMKDFSVKGSSNVEILGQYQTSKTGILVRCKTCDYEWNAQPSNLLHGSGCPVCRYKNNGLNSRMLLKEFYEKLSECNENVYIEVLGDWNGVSKKVLMKCLDCGYEWSVVPQTLLSGHQCPNCRKSGSSYVDYVIFYAIEHVLGEQSVFYRDKTVIGKELDIYIPDKKLAIEPGSWFWHKNKVSNDMNKQNLCSDKGIRCIIIYDSFDGQELLNPDCWTYSDNLGMNKNDFKLRKVVSDIYSVLGISNVISDDDWNIITNRAKSSCKRMSTEEFKVLLSDVRPDIEVIGEIGRMHDAVQVKCKVCGFTWSSEPSRLLLGAGCRKCGRKVCADKLSLSHDEFVLRMSEVNPNITVLGKYVNNRTHIDVRCNVCGHEWSPAASSILSSSHGCPVCWEARRGKALLKSHDEFLKDFSEKGNPNVRILGVYVTSKTPIDVECKVCGHKWSVIPNSLLRGCGCSVCAGHVQKTNEQFLDELRMKHPEIVPLEAYENADKKIKVQCSVCNYEWYVRPVNLIKENSHGCPKCGRERAAAKQRRTTEQYISELAVLNPNIEVLGEYVNANTNTLVRCKVCGHEWSPKPSYFLNMHKYCPVCSKNRT